MNRKTKISNFVDESFSSRLDSASNILQSTDTKVAFYTAEWIERPKSGMRVPVHFWFQDELKKYARHILSPRQIKRAGVFNHRRVKQLLDYDIEEGNGRYGIRLWMLLTFEIWRRIVIERESV